MAGEEASPLVGIGPEGLPGFCVEDGEVSGADWGGLAIVGNGVFVDVAGFFNGAGLAAGINDVTTFGRRAPE